MHLKVFAINDKQREIDPTCDYDTESFSEIQTQDQASIRRVAYHSERYSILVKVLIRTCLGTERVEQILLELADI